MKSPSSILTTALCAAAWLAAPLAASAGNPVYSGGTNSSTGKSDADLAVSANTANFRALGGQLYIHPNGWDPTSTADKNTIQSLFPSPPILEAAISGTDPTSVKNFYNTRIKSRWPTLSAVTVNYLGGVSSTVMQQVVDSFAGVTNRVSIIVAPNSNSSDATNYPFASSHWNQLRANALIGKCITTDAPPDYYFAREEAYRVWIAAAIAWGNANNIQTIVIISPGSSPSGNSFALNSENYIADLEARGARPDVWVYENYYGSSGTVSHPIGSETNISDVNYSALHTLQREAASRMEEAEWLEVVQKSSATHRIITATQFSEGAGTILDATAAGDYVTYQIPNIAAGTYTVHIGVKKAVNRGIFQLSIGRADNFNGTATNIGTAQDLYSSADAWVDLNLGSWTPGTNSDKWFKFNVTGKNATSTGFPISIDYINLIPQ